MQYYVTVFPGIEPIAIQELQERFEIEAGVPVTGRNNVLVPFATKIDVEELMKLGTTEDLFIPLGDHDFTGERYELKTLPDALKETAMLDTALAYHRKTRPASKGKTTFRVVAQAIHDPKEYRRVDLQEALEEAVRARYNKRWECVEDDAMIEIWVHLTKDRAIFGLRLSDERMRHREYKAEHLPASLRPTIAYAMTWLSKIEASDTFLDPMCGSGTILIERARAGRYQQLLGGDLSEEAITTTKTNIGKKYQPIEIQTWDARDLPLESASVDKIVCNIPFGKQIGSPEENQELYGSALGEFLRVIKPSGRIVLLTSEATLLKKKLGQYQELRLIKEYRQISVLGCPASIFVLEPKQV